MSDSKVNIQEPGTTPRALDVEQLSGTLLRERMQIAGALLAEVARVMNGAPVGTEYALVVRSIDQGQVADNTSVASATKLPTLPAKASANPNIWTDGASVPVQVDLSGNLYVKAPSDQTAQTIGAGQNSTITIALSGESVAMVQIVNWSVGVANFEGTLDGVTYQPIPAIVPSTGVIALTASANGIWFLPTGGLRNVRVRVTGNGASMDVYLRACSGTVAILQSAPLPAGTNIIGQVQQAGAPWSVSDAALEASAASIDSKTGTVADRPAAYSLLDRLYQIGLKLDKLVSFDAKDATLQKLVPKLGTPSGGTLLHRS